jgi:hypothetical protein
MINKITKLSIILIIALLLYTVIFWTFRIYKNEEWIKYTESIYHLGVLIALISFLVDQNNTKKQEEDKLINEIIRNEEVGFIDIEQNFLENFPTLFPLYKELNQHNKILQAIPIPKNIDPIQKAQLEINMCNIIIQRIANTYLNGLQLKGYFDTAEYKEWLLTWREWFNSPTLLRVWNTNKNIFFSKRTVYYIDNVVKQANNK